ncbi:hypothetical protein [Klebsiella aerogenes]|uniref:hypothetical protein n=1 Tax=Klebsiella aerogenes TaxID=548 RepID=UPI00063CF937|nr:hypothetical protein [Klebsiella aerogenes]KLF73087.1 hypothetical protein YA38_06330 [Klebsiella aerogenes]
MIDSIKKWLKRQCQNFFWTYFPAGLTIIFALLMEYFFPGSGMLPVGLFFLVTLAFVVYFGK